MSTTLSTTMTTTLSEEQNPFLWEAVLSLSELSGKNTEITTPKKSCTFNQYNMPTAKKRSTGAKKHKCKWSHRERPDAIDHLFGSEILQHDDHNGLNVDCDVVTFQSEAWKLRRDLLQQWDDGHWGYGICFD
jgi:hypothetical protein